VPAEASSSDTCHIWHGYAVHVTLSEAVNDTALEKLMSIEGYRFRSGFALHYINQGRAEGRTEGRTEGWSRSVLIVLRARGLEVPDEVRDRITTCTDLDQLNTWLLRACTASSIDDLFRGAGQLMSYVPYRRRWRTASR
jgi:hypothetical protein